jgi:serine O-acetyltransferase
VGKAIACLLDRVAQLERCLAHRQGLANADNACGVCDDQCAEPGFAPAKPHLQPATVE